MNLPADPSKSEPEAKASQADELTDEAPPAVPAVEAVKRGRSRGSMQMIGEVAILVLDDDRAVCSIIKAALADENYAVETVCEPAQMEAALKSKPYHLVLMDYVIPGLTPDQLFACMQQHQPDASIIVVTGYPSIDSALSCLRARTYDYLTKPFELNQLRDVVERCLESKGLLRMSEEAVREALGTVIRERRKTLGLTLKQLADRTKVSLGYLSQIELGKNSASIETLYRISLGLQIKLADLFHTVEQHWAGQKIGAAHELPLPPR